MQNDLQKQGTGKTLVLSFQHMFAMFGATVLVPMLCNMSISIALLAAGLGTIAFYFITKKKVPVFLGSSFAFLAAMSTWMADAGAIGSETWNDKMGALAVAIWLSGLVYVLLSFIIKGVGVEKVKKFFPPIVVGPVIIVIGMILVPKTFYNNIIGPAMWNGVPAWKEWSTAIITAVAIIATNALAKPKSFLKVIPIMVGFVVGYVYALCIGIVSFSTLENSSIVIFQDLTKDFGFYGHLHFDLSIILAMVPLSIVTFMEHLGDISANSSVCGKDFMVDPGVHRTVLGDGVATIIAGSIGAPPNTTYGENTAVLAITKNYNPRNIFFAACLAVFFGMFTIFGNAIATIPASVIGGASIVLYGMISAAGLRTLVEGKVDFSNTKNMMVVSVILSLGLGLGAMSLAGDITGDLAYKVMVGTVEISPLAICTLVGILLNVIIPNSKDDQVKQPAFMTIEADVQPMGKKSK